MKKIFLVGQKLDLIQFLKKGIEKNKLTRELEFNNKIIENLDFRFLKFLSKIKDERRILKNWAASESEFHLK